MKDASVEQVVARRLGTRADIDQKINGVRAAARNGMNIPDIEYNRQKLTALFGKEETERLVKRMNDARDTALTDAKLIAGSKTAETLAGQKALKVREVEPLKLGSAATALLPGAMAEMGSYILGGPPGIAGLGLLGAGLGLGGARKAAQSAGRAMDAARNTEFARRASALGGAREETINQLLSHPKVTGKSQKSRNALAPY
jgi:hypothetical protein